MSLSEIQSSSIILSVIAILISVVSIFVSFLAAKWFGDVAGTKAAIKYEEDKSKSARMVALQTLMYEILRIQGFSKHNSGLEAEHGIITIESAIKIPVKAFETAFLSRESILIFPMNNDINNGLLVTVMEYLNKAYSINAFIELRLAFIKSLGTGPAHEMIPEVVRRIRDESHQLTLILNRLEEQLHHVSLSVVKVLKTPE